MCSGINIGIRICKVVNMPNGGINIETNGWDLELPFFSCRKPV